MAWGLSGDKPLSEPMMACFTDAYIYVSLSLYESKEFDRHFCKTQKLPDREINKQNFSNPDFRKINGSHFADHIFKSILAFGVNTLPAGALAP